MNGPKQCPNCNGQGGMVVEEIVGYVSHDMAIDGGQPDREGEPMYDWVKYPCSVCGGWGVVEEEPE